ncbi:type II toxin-antitoxin system prevent-host-death family antitoxin [Candidatus Daviesbacteria bacterium]|nr:type II toxin-antitoxin system prevent-host-death family antitoxin [Candidatus Daviesbacteria bacterium]
MNKTIITATEVRNNFFHLLDEVARTGKPIFIKRDRDVKVKLEPVKEDLDKDREETKKLLDRMYGMWSDKTEEELVGRFKEADRLATKKIRSRKW